MAVVRDDPYGQFNFLVEIDGVEAAGFSEVSGLGAETEMIDYRNGNSAVPTPVKIPGLTRYPDVTLRRGIVGSLELWEWVQSLQNGVPAARSIAIMLLDEARHEVLRWELRRAQPIRYANGPLDAGRGDIAMEELVLTHSGLDLG